MKFFLILLLKTNLLLFLVLFATEAFSQSKAIDSLKKIVEIKKEDTTKVNALIELSRVSVDSSNAVQSANDALMMAKKINYKKGEGIANLRIAEMNMHFHKNDEAVKNSFDALRLFQEIKDDNNAVNAYNSIALSYYYQSKRIRKVLNTTMRP